MSLISSISGIRGTVGSGTDNLNPETVLRFTSAFGMMVIASQTEGPWSVVVGRDARVSGLAFSQIVAATLQSLGINVIDIGLATTPTVEMAVVGESASGGIIITASHNPAPWNALKLLNRQGEFLSDQEGRKVLDSAASGNFPFAASSSYGSYKSKEEWTDKHIQEILALPAVDKEAISRAGFKIAVDAVNSVGGIAVPKLLRALGLKEIVEVNCVPNGDFSHNPEPLPDNLSELSLAVIDKHLDLGIAVDPDVDRLALVCEDGSFFGEEYTLVAVADYILGLAPKNNYARATVSNLSSSRALRDVSLKHGASYSPSPVGEVNVVSEMKAMRAIIGGEGNGGIIYPELHHGRDALVGIALFLSHLAHSKQRCSELRQSYPSYHISKNKIEYKKDFDISRALSAVKASFPLAIIDERDGLKLDLEEGWLQLRRSNTEPIIRIYSEAKDCAMAEKLAKEALEIIKSLE